MTGLLTQWLRWESTSWVFFSGVVSGIFLFWLARRRGHPAAFWGCFGLLFGVGAWPIAFVFTRDSLQQEAEIGTGLSPLAKLSAPPQPLQSEEVQGLAQWLQHYRAICYLFLLAVLGVALAVKLPCDLIHFAGPILFQQTAEEYEAGLNRWSWQQRLLDYGWLGAQVFWPSLACYLAMRGGYRVPVIGRLWLQLDRLWMLYAFRAYQAEWRLHVPQEVDRRLPSGIQPAPEELAELRSARDAVNESSFLPRLLWLPALVGGFFLAAGCLAHGILSIFLASI